MCESGRGALSYPGDDCHPQQWAQARSWHGGTLPRSATMHGSQTLRPDPPQAGRVLPGDVAAWDRHSTTSLLFI